MKVAYKLFLVQDDEYVFGPGRWEILQAVRKLGSLRQAALSIGMSYRWAWGRIRDVEQALGVKILVEDAAKGNSRAKVLSSEGRELLDWYEKVGRRLDTQMKKAEETMPEFLRNR